MNKKSSTSNNLSLIFFFQMTDVVLPFFLIKQRLPPFCFCFQSLAPHIIDRRTSHARCGCTRHMYADGARAPEPLENVSPPRSARRNNSERVLPIVNFNGAECRVFETLAVASESHKGGRETARRCALATSTHGHSTWKTSAAKFASKCQLREEHWNHLHSLKAYNPVSVAKQKMKRTQKETKSRTDIKGS